MGKISLFAIAKIVTYMTHLVWYEITLTDCVLEQLKVHGYDVEQVISSGNDELRSQQKALKKYLG